MNVLSVVYPFDGERDIDIALAMTVIANLHQLRSHRLPRLYASGVRYQRERCIVPGVAETCERFLTYRQLLREGVGDCDDLSAARVAELVHYGEDPKARAIVLKIGQGLNGVSYHAVVRRGDGRIEDPSQILGMPMNARSHALLQLAIERRRAADMEAYGQ